MVNNEAFFAKLVDITNIDGADNIKKASVSVNNVVITQVIVSSNITENTQVVYFDSNI